MGNSPHFGRGWPQREFQCGVLSNAVCLVFPGEKVNHTLKLGNEGCVGVRWVEEKEWAFLGR